MKKQFVVAVEPMGKPRMTQRDMWKQRPAVMRYRAYCDVIRAAAGVADKVTVRGPVGLIVTAYFTMPRSWSERERAKLGGTAHTQKPDADNILKGVADALFENDEMVYTQYVVKWWDDGSVPRLEIILDM